MTIKTSPCERCKREIDAARLTYVSIMRLATTSSRLVCRECAYILDDLWTAYVASAQTAQTPEKES